MVPIKVGRHVGSQGLGGNIWADVYKNGGVKLWIKFEDQNKKGEPGMIVSPESWDRLVAWVEFQRKDKEFEKGG